MKRKYFKRVLTLACIAVTTVVSLTACDYVRVLDKGEVYVETHQVRLDDEVTATKGNKATKGGDAMHEIVGEIYGLEENAIKTLKRMQKEQLSKPYNFGR